MKTKVIVVTGGRDLTDEDWGDAIWSALSEYEFDSTVVIHGNAKGADSLAESFAREMGMATIPFPAKWQELGKGAGPRRNKAMIEAVVPMVEYGIDVEVYAFHDDVLSSKGTRHMVRASWEDWLPIRLYRRDGCFTEVRRKSWDEPNPFK